MTVIIIAKTGVAASAFPKAAIEAKLTELLLAAAQSEASLRGVTLPGDMSEQVTASARLDSLDVVSLLCEIEPIMKIELRDSLVRTGGYTSVNQAMDHLMPRLEKAWEKNAKGANK